jgi:hypothetical protein
MYENEKVIELTTKLSDDARHIFLLMSLHWPHGWKMGKNELTFHNLEKRPMVRVYMHTNEGLTVGYDSAIIAASKAKLIEQYNAKENPDGSLNLPFEQLSPGDMFDFMSLLLEGQSA